MAVGFVFRLETLFRVRRESFEQAQRVVAARLGTIQREENAIRSCRDTIEMQHEQARRLQSHGHLDVSILRAHRTYVLQMKQRIGQLERIITQHQQHLAAERETLVSASVAIKAVEKLKERQQERYSDQQRRRRLLADDEAAMQLHLRKRRRATHTVIAGDAVGGKVMGVKFP